ncbi:MAG: hypothetical protein EXR60_01930 [Dehalococcoidia bacterium]|nr:hypothetical protein [Dehalococcoidia bacterium]
MGKVAVDNKSSRVLLIRSAEGECTYIAPNEKVAVDEAALKLSPETQDLIKKGQVKVTPA